MGKKEQTFVNHKFLTDADRKTIAEAARYPVFSELLLSNQKLLDSFFLWALRDGISPTVFIEYPALQQKLSKSYLDGRLGRMGSDLLKIKKIYNDESRAFEKIVTLPFEGKDVNILDDSKGVLD